MNDVRKNIIDWINSQQYWVQLAAEKILRQQVVDDESVEEFLVLLKTDAGQTTDNPVDFTFFNNLSCEDSEIRITSIGEIEGIDDLAPKTPLEFIGNLPLIYGLNGTGKSSYTRILKKACGKPNAIDLKPNVFKPSPAESKCTITINDKGTEESTIWFANAAPIQKMQAVDIFDSQSGQFYLDGETDVCYVPDEVALFENLADLFKKLKIKLDNEKNTLTTILPRKPGEYIDTKYIKVMYERLKPGVEREKLEDVFSYTDKDIKEKTRLEDRLKSSPADLATQKRKRIKQLNSIKKLLNDSSELVSPAACKALFELSVDVNSKRAVANEAALAVSEGAKVDGFGTATWKAMWLAAKNYSKESAYPGESFPNTDEDAKCVLCHQYLDDESRKRLKSFESFVTGELEGQAEKAEKNYKDALEALPEIPSDEQLAMSIQAAQLDEEIWLPKLKSAWSSINEIEKKLKGVNNEVQEGFQLIADFFNELDEVVVLLEQETQQHDIDAQNFDKVKVSADLLDIKGKEWASAYIDAMEVEVQRITEIDQIDEWLKLVRTNALTTKSGEISQAVITTAYVQRFNNELNALGANNIKVELVKTRVAQAKVKHKVQLHGLNIAHVQNNSAQILSEGEQRVVTLAAFLADVTAKPYKTPFIFDDPISSMDQKYEERTARRLIALSEERQVIVFTHRLSFFGLLNAFGHADAKHIRRETWGCGQHSEVPLFAKKPINSLKDLKNNRLQKAKKSFKEEGADVYYPLAKAICSDIRILMERVVEIELLADVVQRHRRELHTLNKVDKLAKITLEDCRFIEKVMGDFSTYEHSQSDEAPVEIPDPENIEASIDSILAWHDEFKNRKIEVQAAIA